MTEPLGHKVSPVSPKGTTPRLFYGYIIVFVILVIFIVMHGIYASFGIFLTEIQNTTHWNRTIISGANSLVFFIIGAFSIVGGRLTDKYGPRIVIMCASICLGVGYFLTAQVSAVWQIYLSYGILVGIGAGFADAPLLSIIARWFTKRRTLMSSIVKVGTGLGMFTIPLLSSWLIINYKWRIAYMVLAGVVFVVVAIAAQFLKRDPSKMGLKPYGTDNGLAANQPISNVDLTLRAVIHTRQFWIVCVVYFIAWFVTQTVMVHYAAHSVDQGLTVSQAASLISTIGGTSILGRLTMGIIGDRVNNRRALVLCCTILLVSIIWLQFAKGLWNSYLFTIVYGFAHGGFFAIISPLIAELFGLSEHGANLGLLFFIGMTGGTIGPVIGGYIYDTQKNYDIAFIMLMVIAAVGLVLALALKPVQRPEQVKLNGVDFP
jgi:MFS family permease